MDDFKPDDFSPDSVEDDFQPDISSTPPPQGILSKTWSALSVPEQKSREGLGMMAGAIPEYEPTGNVFSDVAKNTPRILGETVAEVAPGFISPEAIALGGAGIGARTVSKIPMIQKGASTIGRGLAGGVEKVTGIPASNVRSLFNKPAELFKAPTSKDVKTAYSTSEIPKSGETLDDIVQRGTASYAALVKRGGKTIVKGTDDAKTILEARKALDKQLALLNNQIDTAKAAGRSALIDARNAKLSLREEFNKALDVLAPKHRAADAVAARNLAVSPFRDLTLPGKINFFSPEGLLRAVPGLPSVVGLGVSGAGAATKVAKQLLGVAPSAGDTLGVIADEATSTRKPVFKKRPRPKPIFRKAA